VRPFSEVRGTLCIQRPQSLTVKCMTSEHQAWPRMYTLASSGAARPDAEAALTSLLRRISPFLSRAATAAPTVENSRPAARACAAHMLEAIVQLSPGWQCGPGCGCETAVAGAKV
jgi:hypothetical protein